MFQLKRRRDCVTHFASPGSAAPPHCGHNDNTVKGLRMLLLSSLLCLLLVLWMSAKIWKRNALLAIVTLFLWPVSAFATMRYWGDEHSDIKVPFLLFVPAFAHMLWS